MAGRRELRGGLKSPNNKCVGMHQLPTTFVLQALCIKPAIIFVLLNIYRTNKKAPSDVRSALV